MATPRKYTEEMPFLDEWDFASEDKAVANLCLESFVYEGSPVPITFATPERAFALIRKRFKLNDNQPVPLPFVSIQQVGDAVVDPNRRLAPIIKKRLGNVYDSQDRITHAVQMQWPLPYNFLYTIELWTRNRGEARVLLGSYADQFHCANYGYLLVQYGGGMGLQYVRMENQGISDNSQLETGREQRVLRYTCNLMVYGWRPKKPIKSPVVTRFDLSVERSFGDKLDPEGETVLMEDWKPIVKGNSKTGEVVWDNIDFDPDYDGVDYRDK